MLFVHPQYTQPYCNSVRGCVCETIRAIESVWVTATATLLFNSIDLYDMAYLSHSLSHCCCSLFLCLFTRLDRVNKCRDGVEALRAVYLQFS